MNLKRWILSGVAAFAVIFVLDMIVHGKLLMGLYEQTESVWRPKADANQKMWLMMAGQLLFGLALAWVYTKGYEAGKAGFGQGLRFGLYAGVLVAASQNLVWYVVLPVPLSLALAWLASAFIDCLAAGLVIGLIYRP
jgi:hypothetical protein